jgi:hypothetical protein
MTRMSRGGNGAFDESFPTNWEAEREALFKEIEEMSLDVTTAVNKLERQVYDVRLFGIVDHKSGLNGGDTKAEPLFTSCHWICSSRR